MSLLDDRMVSLRLTHRPELRLRLAEFAQAYGLAGTAALVVQAGPHPDDAKPTLDVDDNALQQQFLAGAGTQRAWWDGFHSMSRARPTFHGVASISNPREPTWASEMHRDGHFVAGVWAFPDLPTSDGRRVSVIADFYCDFFGDFCALVMRTLRQGGVSQAYEVTATLLGAQQLHFAKPSDFGGQHVISAQPLGVATLQWPVLAVDRGEQGWSAASQALGRGLTGAYGAMPPRAR